MRRNLIRYIARGVFSAALGVVIWWEYEMSRVGHGDATVGSQGTGAPLFGVIKVLLVGGDVEDVELLRGCLPGMQRVRVELAHTAGLREARLRLAGGAFDAIIFDLDRQGRKKGELDTLYALEASARGVPVIALTGSADDDQAFKVLVAGAQDYLVKSELNSGQLERALLFGIERKKTEDHLKQTEEQYHAVFAATSDGLVINSTDGRVVEVNPAFCRMHGYTHDEMISMMPAEFIHPDSHGQMRQFFEVVSAGGRFHAQAMDVRKDGTSFHVEVHGISFMYRGEPHILGLVRDITEQVEAYELLEQRVVGRTRELSALLEENARLYAQEQETTRKTAALAQTASQMAFGGSLEATLEILCRHVVDVTGAVASAVVLHDAEAERDRMAVAYGLPVGYAEALNGILASGVRMLLQDAFAGRQPMFRRDMRESILRAPAYAPLHSFLRKVEWDMVVAVPMVYRERPVGVLLSYHAATSEIGETEMMFHAVIADQAAVAVENARLLAQEHDKARLEERQRLARELHDSVTQALFSISLIARSAEVLMEREGTYGGEVMEKMVDLRQLTQGALAEMRALIFELRPGALEEEGLFEALRKHAAAVQSREMLTIEVRYKNGGMLPRLKPAAEEALYRIGQEALHNVVKHAKAEKVEVSIEVVEGRWVVLRVTDDGIGFEPEQVPAGHMGLGTMGQRAGQLGGEYEVRSGIGEGTTIGVRIPLQQWQL